MDLRRSLFTSRVLLFLPSNHAVLEGGALLSRFGKCVERINGTVIRSTPFSLACETSSNKAQNLGSQSDIAIIDTYPAKIRRLLDAIQKDRRFDWRDGLERILDAAQIYNLIRIDGEGISIQSDPLGLKPLYRCDHASGILVASHVSDLLFINRDVASELDETAIKELLIFDHPLGERTLYRGVKRFFAGSKIVWRCDAGLKIEREPLINSISFPVDPNADISTALDEIHAALCESVARHMDHFGSAATIGLTGGFDSRLLAGVCRRVGIDLTAVTFGLRSHSEVRTAFKVSKALSIRHKILPFESTVVRTSVKRNLFTEESMAIPDFGMCVFDDHFEERSQPFIHGYLGDVLGGGGILAKFMSNEHPSHMDHAISTIVATIEHEGRGNLRRALSLDENIDDVINDIHATLPSAKHGHQSLTLWNLENRQRRLISGHFSLTADTLNVVTPFYDLEVVSRYLALPSFALKQRNITRALLRNFYPDLAHIRHSEENQSILRRPIDLPLDFIRSSCWAAIERFPGLDWRLRPWTDIWSWRGRLLESERDFLTNVIEEGYPTLRRFFQIPQQLDRRVISRLGAGELYIYALVSSYLQKIDEDAAAVSFKNLKQEPIKTAFDLP